MVVVEEGRLVVVHQGEARMDFGDWEGMADGSDGFAGGTVGVARVVPCLGEKQSLAQVVGALVDQNSLFLLVDVQAQDRMIRLRMVGQKMMFSDRGVLPSDRAWREFYEHLVAFAPLGIMQV
jgi:hypothetical protein